MEMQAKVAAARLGVAVGTLGELASAGALVREGSGYSEASVERLAAQRERVFNPSPGPRDDVAMMVALTRRGGWNQRLELSPEHDYETAVAGLGEPGPGEVLAGWWPVGDAWFERVVEQGAPLIGETGGFAHQAGQILAAHRRADGLVAFRLRMFSGEELDDVLGVYPNVVRHTAYVALPLAPARASADARDGIDSTKFAEGVWGVRTPLRDFPRGFVEVGGMRLTAADARVLARATVAAADYVDAAADV